MYKIKFILFWSFLFFISTNIFAQPIQAKLIYSDGTVRSLELDNVAFLNKNQVQIANSKVIIPLDEVMSIKIGENVFEPHKVTYHKYFYEYEKHKLNMVEIDTTLILQKIIGGTLSLYNFIDNNDGELWFAKKANEIDELLQIKYSYKSRVMSQDRFKSVLGNFLGDCPSLLSKIGNLKFDRKNLKKIVISYNIECGQLSYKGKNWRQKIEFGINLRTQLLTSNFSKGTFNYNYLERNGLDVFRAISNSIGTYFKIPLRKKNDKFSIIFSPSFSYVIHKISDRRIESPQLNDTSTISTSLKLMNLETYISFRYSFSNGNSKWKPFLEGGIGYRRFLKNVDNSVKTHSIRRGIVVNSEFPLFASKDFPLSQIFYRAAAGVTFQKFDIGFTYFVGNTGFTRSKFETQSGLGVDLKYRLF